MPIPEEAARIIQMPMVQGLLGLMGFLVIFALASPLLQWLFGATERQERARDRKRLADLEQSVAGLTDRLEHLESRPRAETDTE